MDGRLSAPAGSCSAFCESLRAALDGFLVGVLGVTGMCFV
jgi:hypothetical protein